MTEVRVTVVSLEEMQREAAHGYPYESCGIVLGRRHEGSLAMTRTLATRNVAEAAERRRRFMIEPKVVLELQRRLRGTGESIIGFYHSHPDAEARPSPTDMTYFRLWPETMWLIVPVSGGQPGPPRAWWLDDAEAPAPRELTLQLADGDRVGRGSHAARDYGSGVPDRDSAVARR